MSTYRMDDGTIVKTENATHTWKEDTNWDGNNWISVATGSQWHHQKLHRSKKGRYWIEHTSNWQGSQDRAEWVSNRAAVAWLLTNDREIPEELQSLVDEVEE